MNDPTNTPSGAGSDIAAARMTRRTVLRGAAAGSFLALVTGRSVGAAPRPFLATQGTTPAGTASAGTTAAAPMVEIDTLRVGFPSSMTSLYPGKEAGIVNYYAASLVGEGLLAPDPAGNISPALASTWARTSPTTLVFTLRDNATFSDGVAVTPADVVYSIEMANRVERASIAFSISSLTTDAGRSTTSPAAILPIVSLSRS